MIVKIQQNLNKPESERNMMITTKPKGDVGNLKIITKARPDIIEQLDGRPKAYFFAVSNAGVLRVYCEIRPFEEW